MRPRTHAPRPSDAQWRAIRSRAPGAPFLYGVTTTGVLCRAGCPSVRPHRANVRIFPDLEASRGFGFRPCRRCRPEASEPPVVAIHRQALDALQGRAGPRATPSEVARKVGLSRRQLDRVLVDQSGLTASAMHRSARMMRAARLRLEGTTVRSAVSRAGYRSTSSLYQSWGATRALPTKGDEVRFAVRETRLGALLLAATHRGVCFVDLADSSAMAEREFRAAIRGAPIRRDEGDLEPLLDEVLARCEGRGGADVPLDLQGSAFRLRVWHELQRIPMGATRTYGELAAALGRPKAVRAVAAACAANKVAVLVPCHRVVGADGSLRGYRWGVERKAALLDAEALSPRRPSGQRPR